MLRQLLVPVLEHLDLDSVYLTQSVLKTMWTNCPNLRVLSLKDCGYIVTDSIIETLLRVSSGFYFCNFGSESVIIGKNFQYEAKIVKL